MKLNNQKIRLSFLLILSLTSCFGSVTNNIDSKIDIKVSASANVNATSKIDSKVNVNTDIKANDVIVNKPVVLETPKIKKVVSVSVSPPNFSMNVGEELKLLATVKYDDGSTDNEISWFSFNTKLLTIDQKTGTFKALGSGSVVVTATAFKDASVSTIVNIVINEKNISPVVITSATPTPTPTATPIIQASNLPVNTYPAPSTTPYSFYPPYPSPAGMPFPTSVPTSNPVSNTFTVSSVIFTNYAKEPLNLMNSFGIAVGRYSVFISSTVGNFYKNRTRTADVIAFNTFNGLLFTFNENDLGNNAIINNIQYIALDSLDNIVVSDIATNSIKKYKGLVSTFSILGENVQINKPQGITTDKSDDVIVVDSGNNRIMKLRENGNNGIFAGSQMGDLDGVGINAKFNSPTGIAIDRLGNFFVCDTKNYKIKKITSDAVVTTFAGSQMGDLDGVGINAKFNNPTAIAIDLYNNIYVIDNYKIKRITPDGTVSTIAGSIKGDLDGTGDNAKFNNPRGLAIDHSGNLLVTDETKIRKITLNK